MSQLATELADKLFEGLGAVKEAALAVAPGLSNLGPDIKAELKQQVTHSAHELAACLFNGSGFVMYPRNSGRDDHGVHSPDRDAGAQSMEQEQSHGRSM